MNNKENIVDIKSILWLIDKFLRNTTDEQRLFFGLEVNRILLNLQTEPAQSKVKRKIKMV